VKDVSLLLGKRVRVLLSTDPDPHIVVEGQLLAFGDMGEFVVRDDGDEVMHCWPLLGIEEAV
jgi:hypothetical protein